MLDIFKNILNKGNSTKAKPVEFDFEGEIKFTLRIEDLTIGALSIEDSQWVFRYSEEFKIQEKYERLTGFSDLDKTYRADVLWPFFKIRIPGLKQPMIRDIIRDENLDEANEAALLQRFGRESMSNPYILEVN